MTFLYNIAVKGLNPDKPEITNYKQQITNKFQVTISKSQIRSNATCLEFRILGIVICLVFVICYLKFITENLNNDTWKSSFSYKHVVK